MNPFAALDSSLAAAPLRRAPLGIGFPYMPVVPPQLYQSGGIDFVEVTPEALCRERRKGDSAFLELIPEQVEQARKACTGLPMVVHGVELSIGSAHGWSESYLDMLDRFQAVWPFVWHSEHLGFQTIDGDSRSILEIGVPLPLPASQEAARLVIDRSSELRRRYRVPFLLENPAHYLPDMPSDPEIGDEISFMNLITRESECGQLLDLHNLYCNSINHGFDVIEAIDRVDLSRVVEIHVAGGSWRNQFWMDAHDGCVPGMVWELLEYTMPRAPNVAGVVFEVLDQHAPALGVDRIFGELEHARSIWQRCRERQRAAA